MIHDDERTPRRHCRQAALVLMAAWIAMGLVATSASAASATPAPASALKWRSIGPYIGGRVVAVAGVPSKPDLFYMGAVDGGVW